MMYRTTVIEVLYNPTNTTGGPRRSTFQQIATRRRCSYWHSDNVQAVNKAQFGQEILQTHGGFLRHGRPPVIIHLLLGFSMKETICFVGTISFMETPIYGTPRLWKPTFMETPMYGNHHMILASDVLKWANTWICYKRSDVLVYSPP